MGQHKDTTVTLSIEQAIASLEAGRLVAFPTETVYGLGADARNEAAVQQIFEAKGRPADHPVIVHVASINQLGDWAKNIPEAAYILAEAFWPGPMTLILNRADTVLDVVTGGQETVGIRIPSHPVALALLEGFGRGVAAPSANRFGRISPTTTQHVVEELHGAVDLILEGGPCKVGLESTIINMTGPHPEIIRPGHIQPLQLEALLGYPVAVTQVANLKASGTLDSHYSPETKVRLLSTEALHQQQETFMASKTIGVLTYSLSASFGASPRVHPTIIQASADPVLYGQGLYHHLRVLDAQGLQEIWVEMPPDTPEWLAVWDRLSRAASPS